MKTKLKQFLEDNPNITVLGFAWSCYWRLCLVIFGITIGLAIVGELLN